VRQSAHRRCAYMERGRAGARAERPVRQSDHGGVSFRPQAAAASRRAARIGASFSALARGMDVAVPKHALASSLCLGIGVSWVRRGVRRSLHLERRAGHVVHSDTRRHTRDFTRVERGGSRRCVVGRCVVGRCVVGRCVVGRCVVGRCVVGRSFDVRASERQHGATVRPPSAPLSGFVQRLRRDARRLLHRVQRRGRVHPSRPRLSRRFPV
jgi:hypothetical protein